MDGKSRKNERRRSAKGLRQNISVDSDFQLRQSKKRTDHAKSATFIGHEFFCERDGQPYFKFRTKKGVVPIYPIIPSMLCFL
jgi:hypothetical protein